MNVIVLSGGTSKRFGSDKSLAKINGKSLLEIIAEYLKEYELIIVGPESSINAQYVREVPEFSGPLAAIGAGLSLVRSELVGIFATDMPFAPKLIDQLIGNVLGDAALPVDEDGQVQPLAGVYKTARLRSTLEEYPTLENRSVKSMLKNLNIDLVPTIDAELLLDIDTEEDLVQASILHSRFAI